MDACIGVTWFVSVPAETRCWLPRPQTREKTYRYTGAVRSKCVVASQEQAPLTVKALAHSLASWCWYRRTVSAGTRGPIVYEWSRTRVTRCKEGLPSGACGS